MFSGSPVQRDKDTGGNRTTSKLPQRTQLGQQSAAGSSRLQSPQYGLPAEAAAYVLGPSATSKDSERAVALSVEAARLARQVPSGTRAKPGKVRVIQVSKAAEAHSNTWRGRTPEVPAPRERIASAHDETEVPQMPSSARRNEVVHALKALPLSTTGPQKDSILRVGGNAASKSPCAQAMRDQTPPLPRQHRPYTRVNRALYTGWRPPTPPIPHSLPRDTETSELFQLRSEVKRLHQRLHDLMTLYDAGTMSTKIAGPTNPACTGVHDRVVRSPPTWISGDALQSDLSRPPTRGLPTAADTTEPFVPEERMSKRGERPGACRLYSLNSIMANSPPRSESAHRSLRSPTSFPKFSVYPACTQTPAAVKYCHKLPTIDRRRPQTPLPGSAK